MSPTAASPTTPALMPMVELSTLLASIPPQALHAFSLALQLLQEFPKKGSSSAYLQCFFMSIVDRTHWLPPQSSDSHQMRPKQEQVLA